MRRTDLLERVSASPGVEAIVAKCAVASDELDRELRSYMAASGVAEKGLCVLATGSYGRRELAPSSDVDLAFIVSRPSSQLQSVAEALYPLWDRKVRLDYSFRTIRETLAQAGASAKVLLTLSGSRYLWGDHELYRSFISSFEKSFRRLAKSVYHEVAELARKRTERFGHVAFSEYPDLKESCGGLRDSGVAQALVTLVPLELPEEMAADLRAAHRVLLAARYLVQELRGRPDNRLEESMKPRLAAALGLEGSQELSEALAAAGRLVEMVTEEVFFRARAALFGPVPGFRRAVSKEPGILVNRQGELLLEDLPYPDPALPLRLFSASAQLRAPISAGAYEQARRHARQPASGRACLQALVTLLTSSDRTVHLLEQLQYFSVLDAYLPDLAAVSALPPRGPHVYPVDRHLFESAAIASSLRDQTERPDLLVLAALLHDIGKGRGDDHSEAGARIAREVAERLGYDEADSELLADLVRLHLLLPETATRQDIANEEVVSRVASMARSPLTVSLLRLLALADLRATNPALLTSWKVRLIDELASAVTDYLQRGSFVLPSHALPTGLNPPEDPEAVGLEVEGDRVIVYAPDFPGTLARIAGVLFLNHVDVVQARIRPRGRGAAMDVFFVSYPYGEPPDWAKVSAQLARYIRDDEALRERIEARLRSVKAPRAWPAGKQSQVTVTVHGSPGGNAIQVRCPDSPGLLYEVSSLIARAGFSIETALVDTFGREVIDVFYVRRADQSAPGHEELERLAGLIQLELERLFSDGGRGLSRA